MSHRTHDVGSYPGGREPTTRPDSRRPGTVATNSRALSGAIRPAGTLPDRAMPIERRNSTTQVRAILIAVVSVIFAATLGYAIVRVATTQKSSVNGGSASGVWNAGSAERLAKAIDRDGPILLSDVSGAGQRLPVYISHVGSTSTTGWHAFVARPIGAPDSCFITWNRTANVFRSSCDSSTYPIEGVGLRVFPVTVSKFGDVFVDLKPKSTTTTSTTSTAISR